MSPYDFTSFSMVTLTYAFGAKRTSGDAPRYSVRDPSPTSGPAHERSLSADMKGTREQTPSQAALTQLLASARRAALLGRQPKQAYRRNIAGIVSLYFARGSRT